MVGVCSFGFGISLDMYVIGVWCCGWKFRMDVIWVCGVFVYYDLVIWLDFFFDWLKMLRLVV